RNRSHWSTSKTPSYTKSVSWQHHREQKLSFYLSGATTDSSRQVFANTAPDATKASGVGVTLMRNGKILATGENVSLGTVNKSKVPLGLSATYGQTGNKVSAGTVQSVIGVTFIYE
ncbi:fimbrial protein, partial [Escherichia coli]|uniref:fimbrial protein n=1 Tax=Escherichia coli TaxID=562 RepID=UPI003FD150CE